MTAETDAKIAITQNMEKCFCTVALVPSSYLCSFLAFDDTKSTNHYTITAKLMPPRLKTATYWVSFLMDPMRLKKT